LQSFFQSFAMFDFIVLIDRPVSNGHSKKAAFAAFLESATAPRFISLCRDLLHQPLECLWGVLRHFGEHLAVDFHVLFLHLADEFAVGMAKRAERRIDADVPEPSEVALLVSSVGECAGVRMHELLISELPLGSSRASKAFCLFQYVPSCLEGVNALFYSYHVGLKMSGIKKIK